MREELVVSVHSFYGDIRVKVGLVMGFLLSIASALLAAGGRPTPARASLLVGLVTLIAASFWAYHLLRLRHEAGYIDPRIERLPEVPRVGNKHAEGVRSALLSRVDLPSGTTLRLSFTAPIYDALVIYRVSGGLKRSFDWDEMSIDLNTLEIRLDRTLGPQTEFIIQVESTVPTRLRSAHVTTPTAGPRSTTAPAPPPPPLPESS